MSLVEMVVVISIMAMLMSFGVVLIGLLLRADAAGHEAVAAQLSLERLGRQFRADGHRARTAALEGELQDTLRLHLSDNSQVVWTAAGSVVHRELQSDSSTEAVESYRLSEGETEFSIDEAGGCIELRCRQPFAPLTEATIDERPQPQLELQIVAALGIGIVPTPDATISEASSRGAN